MKKVLTLLLLGILMSSPLRASAEGKIQCPRLQGEYRNGDLIDFNGKVTLDGTNSWRIMLEEKNQIKLGDESESVITYSAPIDWSEPPDVKNPGRAPLCHLLGDKISLILMLQTKIYQKDGGPYQKCLAYGTEFWCG
jgi:hypothetical protein